MSPEPPFIADFLSFLLFAACAFMLVYAFLERFNFFKKSKTRQVQTNKNETKDIKETSTSHQFFIEPSPIPGENILFPSIYDLSELQFSIIIPIRNEEDRIFSLLSDIYEYFLEYKSKNVEFTYEVIIVNNSSNDNTYDISVNFSREHSEFRVLSLPYFSSLNESISISGLRTRGQYIFLYLPFQGIPFSIFETYQEEIINDLYNTERFIIVGKYLKNSENDEIKRSSLSVFCEYLANKALDVYGVKSSARNICGAVMFSREAGRIIFRQLKITPSGYDYEMLIIAKATEIKVKVVRLNIENEFSSTFPTSYRIKTFQTVLQTIFSYLFNNRNN